MARVLLVAVLALLAVGSSNAEETESAEGAISQEEIAEGTISQEEIQMMLKAIKEAEDMGELDILEEVSLNPELQQVDKKQQWQRFADAGLLPEDTTTKQSSYERAKADLLGDDVKVAEDPVTADDQKAFMENVAKLADQNMTAEENEEAKAAEKKKEMLPPDASR